MAVETASRALFGSIIDYAGLFPPARLEMPAALAEYRDCAREDFKWTLGNFVLPLERWEDFKAATGGAGMTGRRPWPLSLIVDAGGLRDGAIDELRASSASWAAVGSIEVRPTDPEEVAEVVRTLPRDVPTFFEVPLDERLAERLDAVAAGGGLAKIRTGGLSPLTFPEASDLAQFLVAAWRRAISFKATAGLHHPIRGSYSIDPQAVPPRSCWMHGFANLSLACVFLAAGTIAEHEVVEILSESSPSVFRFDRKKIVWRDREAGLEEIVRARRGFFASFGCCSFREPIEELVRLGWIARAPAAMPV